MSSQKLDVSALIQSLPNKLPQGKRKLESPQDAITALIHTALTILGLQLSGVDENDGVEGLNRSGGARPNWIGVPVPSRSLSFQVTLSLPGLIEGVST